MAPTDRYTSFLLRLQWTQNDNHPTWVASIQSTKTGELRRFPDLEALVQFLRDEFGECEGAKDPGQPAAPDASATQSAKPAAPPEQDHQRPGSR